MRALHLALFAIIFVQVLLYAHSSILAAPQSNVQNFHHGQVNGFLRTEPLGWSESYYETGNRIADRMYLTYWILAQALVVEISGVPIFLARYLINPFVMLMSVVGMYVFARNLGHCRKSSLVFVILGLLGYSLVMQIARQPGAQFFSHAIIDKVIASFALAPVAISSAWLCQKSVHRRAYFAFTLSFLATVSVHAIPGGFTATVIGIWCMVRFFAERGGQKNAIQIGLLMLVLLSPVILLRFTSEEPYLNKYYQVPEQGFREIAVFNAINPFDNGNRFYAINPHWAGNLTYILFALALVSVVVRRLDSRSKLMLAYVIAISIGLLPFTAWIYGRLVSVEHIVRVLWLLPYGYMLGFILETGCALAFRHVPGAKPILTELGKDKLLVLLLTMALIVTAHNLQLHYKSDFTKDISHATVDDHETLKIAEYIDTHHDERVWIAASPEERYRAMSMSWRVISLSHFSALTMSYYSRLPYDQAEKQRSDNLRLYKADVSVEEKLAIIDQYGIDYLLFPKQYSWMIDGLYQLDKSRFELVYSGETLRLIRVHD